MENRTKEECELILLLLKAHCKGDVKLSIPYRQKFNKGKEDNDRMLTLTKQGGFKTVLRQSEFDGYLKLIGDFNIEKVKKLSIAYQYGCTEPYNKSKEDIVESFYEVDFLLQ